jgi:MFS family permease
MITFFLCLLSVLASTLSPLLAANTLTLLVYYKGQHSITDMALLTGYHLLGVGISGFFVVPLARVWGKRWLVLLGTLIIIISCIWAGFSGENYNSLVAARFFQGIGLAPFEGLVNAMVGELYFVHESGVRMALSNLCLFGGAFFTPVIVGKSTASLGWQWTFWLVAIFTAAVFPLVYLFCPETTFDREKAAIASYALDSDSTSSKHAQHNNVINDDKHAHAAIRTTSAVSGDTKESSTESIDRAVLSSTTSQPGPYPLPAAQHQKLITRKTLALFSGRHDQRNFFALAVRPLPLFFQPAFLWCSLIQGAMIAWVAMLGVSLALFTINLGFTEVETGYMYAGAFIGAILAFGLAGLVSDAGARYMTKKNNGVFEPEFRMILVLPMILFGVGGLFGYGVIAADPKYGWLPLDVFFGFIVGGMTLGAIVSAQYIIDGYRDLAIEGLTCLVMFKNFITFGITYKGFDWLAELSARPMFFLFAYVQLGICLSTIPMCKLEISFSSLGGRMMMMMGMMMTDW